jgi:hypothetical protein
MDLPIAVLDMLKAEEQVSDKDFAADPRGCRGTAARIGSPMRWFSCYAARLKDNV